MYGSGCLRHWSNTSKGGDITIDHVSIKQDLIGQSYLSPITLDNREPGREMERATI